MRISGSGAVRGPAERVWAALADRDLLLRAFPGVDRLDASGNGRYEFTVTIPIAAVSGTYSGEAVVSYAEAPSRLVARVSAAGAGGIVDADLTVRLDPGSAGGTELSYEADAEVTGSIAGIGQRLLASIGKRLAADLVAGVDRELAARPAAAHPAGRPAGRPVQREQLPPERGDGPEPVVRVGLMVGAAAGLAGMAVGALLGRRSRARVPGRR